MGQGKFDTFNSLGSAQLINRICVREEKGIWEA